MQMTVQFVRHAGTPTRRCCVAEELRNGIIQAYDDGDLALAKRLETHYESILETSAEEFADLHD